MQGDPILFLSTRLRGTEDYLSCLFAAIRVDASLCKRLRLASNLCKRHKLECVQFRHTGGPIYWDTPGPSLENCLEEYSEWTVDSHHASVTLWGRTQYEDGGHSEIVAIADSWVADVDHLEFMRREGVDADYWEHPEWEEKTGNFFAVSVHDRMAELRLTPPPPGVSAH